ncbi:MAG: hypothetical protein OFPII_42450 [Osedax symbiont Rs1]|nr:MAG: hypothetical protein OFPII_42450 [Osedax symbiont Rs1]
MQYLLTEKGYQVKNLGPCTPAAMVLKAIASEHYDLIVVSTVNGHGYLEAPSLAQAIRSVESYSHKLIIGGKISTDNSAKSVQIKTANLLFSGFDAVFDDSDSDIFDQFEKFLLLSCNYDLKNIQCIHQCEQTTINSHIKAGHQNVRF